MGFRGAAFLLVTALSCAAAGWGVWRGHRWGQLIAIALIILNLIGDLTNLILRGQFRTLISIPLALLMFGYLLSKPAQVHFEGPRSHPQLRQ